MHVFVSVASCNACTFILHAPVLEESAEAHARPLPSTRVSVVGGENLLTGRHCIIYSFFLLNQAAKAVKLQTVLFCCCAVLGGESGPAPGRPAIVSTMLVSDEGRCFVFRFLLWIVLASLCAFRLSSTPPDSTYSHYYSLPPLGSLATDQTTLRFAAARDGPTIQDAPVANERTRRRCVGSPLSASRNEGIYLPFPSLCGYHMMR